MTGKGGPVFSWPTMFPHVPLFFSHFATKATPNSGVSPSCNVTRPRHKTEYDRQDIKNNVRPLPSKTSVNIVVQLTNAINTLTSVKP